ncbi:plasma-membrane choline transporter family protein [Nitzschia inconspicua]|uniref:Choline transporter-like protein n=1 Tax=Nitzschia inconspicua TaxID=303405 RepID=A0A9K3PFU4_9STRA|nr:plasma-membrane choline transporter family protein [Nitzschia inconspicua]
MSSHNDHHYRYKETIDDYNGDSRDDQEAHELLKAPADFDGPTRDRYCTDVLCLFFIVLAWIIMTGLGVYAVHNGDYRHVLYPLDYQGNICGTDYNGVDMVDYPYLLYVNFYTGGVCAAECPQLAGETTDSLTDMQTLVTYGGIFQGPDAQLSEDFVQLSPHYQSMVTNTTTIDDNRNLNFQCTMETCFGSVDTNNSFDPRQSWTSPGINQGFGMAYYVGDTYPLFQRCFLTKEADDQMAAHIGDDTVSSFPWTPASSFFTESSQQFFTNLYGDLWEARWYILGFGFGASLLVSLIYMALLRIPCLLTGVVWGSIALVISLFGFVGYYAYTTATEWSQLDKPPVRSDQISYTFYVSYICMGISLVMLLFAICLRSSIQLAITCVQHGGAAINAMVMLLFVPFLQICGFLAFWIVWMWFGIHLASLGNIEMTTYPIPGSDLEVTIRVYSYDDFTEYCGWYMLFCFFWTAGFIGAFGNMIVSMAVSTWYFTIDRQVSSCTVVNSILTTSRYHLGTCAYGSLLVAIVQLTRAIITRFQKRVAQLTNQNIARCLFCFCQCCLCCVEKCLKFINKNAYVQCAIFGTPFCESGRKAFFLILRNASTVGALGMVSGGVLWIGKVVISTLTTTIAYYVMTSYMGLSLHSFAAPCLTIFILSYIVAGMFMSVFELSILTVLHCYIADQEMFDGRARYADGSLKDWIDKNSTASTEERNDRSSSVVISTYKR